MHNGCGWFFQGERGAPGDRGGVGPRGLPGERGPIGPGGEGGEPVSQSPYIFPANKQNN